MYSSCSTLVVLHGNAVVLSHMMHVPRSEADEPLGNPAITHNLYHDAPSPCYLELVAPNIIEVWNA